MKDCRTCGKRGAAVFFWSAMDAYLAEMKSAVNSTARAHTFHLPEGCIHAKINGYGYHSFAMEGRQMGRRKGLSFYRKRKRIRTEIVKEVISWISGIVLSVFLAFILVYTVGMRTNIVGESMEPGLANGQNILVSRFSYKLGSPKTGDVIVFRPNGNENAHYYVKRVVAVPGQTVLIQDGILYVDGEPVGTESYDLIAFAGIAENEIVLGNKEYFVMGDNCNSSEDSRSSNIGTVRKETIVGKAWYKLGGGTGFGFIE